MNLVFGMDGVICTPCKDYHEVERAKVMATKEWLADNQIPYDRLLFDRPYNPVMVTETPPNAKYYKHDTDLGIVTDLFEEWKNAEISRQQK
jgi:hypothetical protein